MLHRLWNQETFSAVAERFRVSRGWLQNVLQATCSQASSIARFAEVKFTFFNLKVLKGLGNGCFKYIMKSD